MPRPNSRSLPTAGCIGWAEIKRNAGHLRYGRSGSEPDPVIPRNITADWKRASKEWKSAMNQFAILYGDRFTLAPR